MIVRLVLEIIVAAWLGCCVVITLAAGVWYDGYHVARQGASRTPVPFGWLSVAARLWTSGYLAGADGRELAKLERVGAHLAAIAGDVQVVFAVAGRPVPSPGLALSLAEDRYLERSGWTRHADGWGPRWAPEESWERGRALERQRRGDSQPPPTVWTTTAGERARA